ncbi:MAG: PDZ domain-containing protein [Ignavibacteriae bacterium]|nr:PDZ domain-containing protein [Ignavibacteriota bacterium]
MTRVLLTLLLCCSFAFAQKPVEYKASFDNAVHHEAEISVTFRDIPTQKLEVRMSRTSPGRYALHEFAKNVYNVRAVDSKGKQLVVTRPNPHQWDVTGHDGTVTISYTLFGDHADGTYTGIDSTHAHMNMPATFMWARGFEKRPITITFKKFADSWKYATQLAPTSDPNTFTAPHLQYFLDSPTELSDYMLREWSITHGGKKYTYRIALHHQGTEKAADVYAELGKLVVNEAIAVFGEPAPYDYGTYTFIADYLPWVSGDGMEHRNSTIISTTRPLSPDPLGHLGTYSHEFFHSWNVERIRPKSLEPFNFEEANMSGELWLAEGFTSYYDALFIHRAQLTNLESYARSLRGDVNYVMNAAGSKYFSLIEMSMQAPFVDAARSVDAQNKENTFISYYTWGAAVGLGLDLTLRTKFPGITLDDLMKSLWQKYGKTEIPYTNEEVRITLGEVTKDPVFANDFFKRYIYGREIIDYEKLLASAGLVLRKAAPGKASLGSVFINYQRGTPTLGSQPHVESPLYKAGLDRTDMILSIGGKAFSNAKEMDSLLAKYKPGDIVSVEFEQRGMKKTARLILEEERRIEIVPYENASMTVTDAMTKFRQEWLDTKANAKEVTKTCGTCNRTFAFKTEKCSFDGEELKAITE